MVYGVARVERPKEDTLATAVSAANDTSWQFDTYTMWKRDDYAEDAVAGEIVILGADHGDGVDVAVRRGQRGTTAAASYSAGDVFYRNPVFPRYVIERFIEEVIESELAPHVWMWAETTLNYNPPDTTYDLPADCIDVLDVYQYNIASDGKLHPIDRKNWEFRPVAASAVTATGKTLRLFGVYDSDETVYVTYKQKPTTGDYSTLSDAVASLIPWRVVGKLLAGTRVGPARVAPGRAEPIAEGPQGVKRDAAYFDLEFRRKRKDVRNELKMDERNMRQKAHRRGRTVRRG